MRKIEEPLEAFDEDAGVETHRFDGERSLDPYRVGRLSAGPAVPHVRQHLSVARRERHRPGNLARREELSLSVPSDHHRHDARLPGIDAIAVRFSEGRSELGKRARCDLDLLSLESGREPGLERAVEVELEVNPQTERRGARCCFVGAGAFEERIAEGNRERKIGCEDGDVRAGSEGGEATRATPREGIVRVAWASTTWL